MEDIELPPGLRFLRQLVTVLTVVMIVGVVLIAALLVIRLNQPALAIPDQITLPAGTVVVSYTQSQDWFAVVSTSAMAIEDSRVPGGVAVIPIEPDSRPTFDGKPVLTITDNGQNLAVVGLPLSLEPGTHQLQNMGKQIPFEVRPKKYLEQRIYLKNQRHVTPNPLDLDRIKGESKRRQEPGQRS